MMKKLRGRNLAHPGCLIGITAGLTLGIVLAAILAKLNVALNTVLLIWLALTLGLGVIGWFIGDRLTWRFPALEDRASVDQAHPEDASPPVLTCFSCSARVLWH